MTDRLLLDERIHADGRRVRSWIARDAERLRIVDDDGTGGPISLAALDRVMVRYGRALDDGVALAGDALELAGGIRLRRLRFHAQVDATGRDYLVWERPAEAPLAVLATHATAALTYLALRIEGERPSGI